MILTTGLFLLLALLAAGLPVALSLLLGGGAGLYLVGGWQMLEGVLSTAPASALSSYELLTIPMFLLMAEFMVVSGISSNLFNAIATWTGRVRGGLGIATTLTGAAFGAISGSSAAAAATLSTTSIPAMQRAGYEQSFATGIVSISGTLAMLIPPSIAIIFYGLLSGADIGRLLIAGIVPGILVTLTIAFTIWLMIWRNPGRSRRWRWQLVVRKTTVTARHRSLRAPFRFGDGLYLLGHRYTGGSIRPGRGGRICTYAALRQTHARKPQAGTHQDLHHIRDDWPHHRMCTAVRHVSYHHRRNPRPDRVGLQCGLASLRDSCRPGSAVSLAGMLS